MKIRFAPPHLEQANCVPAIRRTVTQLSSEWTMAELRIFQLLSHHELKLSLCSPHLPEVNVTIPKDWLYHPEQEERMRNCLAELFASARGHLKAIPN